MSVTVQRDTTNPVVTYTGNAGSYTVDQTIDIHCAASDPSPGSGLESTTCEDISGPAWSFTLGSHTFSATAQDVAGNVGTKSTTFTIGVTFDSLDELVSRFSTNAGIATCSDRKLDRRQRRRRTRTRARNQLGAFANQVNAQTGKALTEEQAQLLIALADTLR